MAKLWLLVCVTLIFFNNVACEGLPPLCNKEDMHVALHAEIDETLNHYICLYGLSNADVHTWLMHEGIKTDKPNFELFITEAENGFKALNFLIRNVTGDDFGEYSITILVMVEKISVSSTIRLQIKQKFQPKLCHNKDNTTTLVAPLGTNAVFKLCFESDMRSSNWPLLNISGHLIHAGSKDFDNVNFTYVTNRTAARRHMLIVSFNNITLEDYGYHNIVLMTGYLAELKFTVIIQAKQSCGVLFNVTEVDEYEKSFTLICRSSCYPRQIGIGMKHHNFLRTTLNNVRANITRQLSEGPRTFSCEDEGTYICNITYYGGVIVVKEKKVDFKDCKQYRSRTSRNARQLNRKSFK